MGYRNHHKAVALGAARPASSSKISKINFGFPIAEHEGLELSQYYLEIAEFTRAQNGEYQVVAGRKGSGKTAFFLELRNSLKRNPNNIILDLQPEGYQLLKFREAALSTLAEGSKQHLLTALWEYVILLEIANRMLRDDKSKHVHNHLLQKPYHNLAAFVSQFSVQNGNEGDFAERLEGVLSDVAHRIKAFVDPSKEDNTLSYPNITELLHRCDIHELSKLVQDYVQHKAGVWILVDNLDKGWPATGIERDDLTMVRCLQDALHKIEKPLRKLQIPCRGVLFLRSDVYDRLVVETSDKGKVQRATLDLSNPNVLREMIRRRIAFNLSDGEILLEEIWPELCVSHISKTGEDSFDFLIDRSLMRPRGLIELIRSCQSTAVTLQHDRIHETDLKDGTEAYSVELASNITLEIRDVYPESPDVIYALLGSNRRMRLSEVKNILVGAGLSEDSFGEYCDLLLRYGVLGLVDSSGVGQFIFHHHYELRRLKAVQAHLAADADAMVDINPAFWAALEIDDIP